ncbi:Aste57867_8731 [Aphanomyces stellatus]|uniref:Aste57867_8731 protein n=1 Tax=Aphanomyces stellatus TaxID=120398 RepID=A0A485KL41_9STRA|nr:hypothetical protein As57867_008697 [Aphanomyces stellatus]VFT85617.1 Aste57867_8731 [Aphanomyces stellatus]
MWSSPGGVEFDFVNDMPQPDTILGHSNDPPHAVPLADSTLPSVVDVAAPNSLAPVGAPPSPSEGHTFPIQSPDSSILASDDFTFPHVWPPEGDNSVTVVKKTSTVLMTCPPDMQNVLPLQAPMSNKRMRSAHVPQATSIKPSKKLCTEELCTTLARLGGECAGHWG